MVQIEVAHSLLERNGHLPPLHVVFITIDDRPHCLIVQRPPTREDSIHVHRVKWLPLWANEEWRYSALHRRHPSCSLGIARSQLVPDSPHILPALPALAVKKSILQIVCFISIPPPLNIDLMPCL